MRVAPKVTLTDEQRGAIHTDILDFRARVLAIILSVCPESKFELGGVHLVSLVGSC